MQRATGGLRYLTHTRPDIAFVVGYVSRFMEEPCEDHWTTVKRLLCYVKGTLDQAIIFPKAKESEPELTVFSDADMAGDMTDDRAPLVCLSSLEQPPSSSNR
jgi:hypothetical protein